MNIQLFEAGAILVPAAALWLEPWEARPKVSPPL